MPNILGNVVCEWDINRVFVEKEVGMILSCYYIGEIFPDEDFLSRRLSKATQDEEMLCYGMKCNAVQCNAMQRKVE